jgi:hypothetical protein
MRPLNSGLPEFSNIIVEVGNSRLGWRRPGIHNHRAGNFGAERDIRVYGFRVRAEEARPGMTADLGELK